MHVGKGLNYIMKIRFNLEDKYLRHFNYERTSLNMSTSEYLNYIIIEHFQKTVGYLLTDDNCKNNYENKES